MSIINEEALKRDIVETLNDSLGVSIDKAEKLADMHIDKIMDDMYQAITDRCFTINIKEK